MKLKKSLFIIFFLALALRTVFLIESTYFGFDEARDAYISQEIYTEGNLKLIGPPANAAGLFHGPFHWYLLGPLYLLAEGDPYTVSLIFRFINALGIFLIFSIGLLYFNYRVGLIAAIIYTFSFEQNQYAMYIVNPTLANFSWMAIFLGVGILLKNQSKGKLWGLPLIAGGAASAAQLELLLFYSFGVVGLLLILLREKLKKISRVALGIAILSFFSFAGTYLLAEIKYHFQGIKAGLGLLQNGYGVMGKEDNRISLYLKNFALMFRDNIFPLEGFWLYILALGIIFSLIYFARKSTPLRYILIWIMAGIFLLPLGGYNAYYTNVGLGLGVIIGAAFLLNEIWQRNKILGLILLVSIILSNLTRVYDQSGASLIVEMKPQPLMKLADEIKIINYMYAYTKGQAFTIRVTGIPYKVQTVWAYLFHTYGLKKWDYLPYMETGMVAGFPGKLPVPQEGTTCIRFLIREPVRGIPKELIEHDQTEENLFSAVIKEDEMGAFLVQTRQSKDKNCYQNRL